jgi:hypothetical protein
MDFVSWEVREAAAAASFSGCADRFGFGGLRGKRGLTEALNEHARPVRKYDYCTCAGATCLVE